MQLSKDEILRRLQDSAVVPTDAAHVEKKSAAVLVPLIRIEQEWHLLYIRRAEQPGDIHSGQVAFPGGLAEAGDVNASMTALREAHEEIGLQPELVTLVGRLCDCTSAARYRVTPIVGLIAWPCELALQRSEVSHVFTIPLSWLADSTNVELRPWYLANTAKQVKIPYYKPYNGELLWGLTAKITLDLIKELEREK